MFNCRLKELEKKLLKRENKDVINPSGSKLDVGVVRCEVNRNQYSPSGYDDEDEDTPRLDERIFFSLTMNQEYYVSEKTEISTIPSWGEKFAFTLKNGKEKIIIKLYVYNTLDGEAQIDKITVPLQNLLEEFIDQVPKHKTFISPKKNVFEVFFRWRHDEDLMRLKELKSKFERFEKLRLKEETNYIRANYAVQHFLKKEGLALLNEWGFLNIEPSSDSASPEQTIMLSDNDYFKSKKRTSRLPSGENNKDILSLDTESQMSWLTLNKSHFNISSHSIAKQQSGKLSQRFSEGSGKKHDTNLNLSIGGGSMMRSSQPSQHYLRQGVHGKQSIVPSLNKTDILLHQSPQYSDIEDRSFRVLSPQSQTSNMRILRTGAPIKSSMYASTTVLHKETSPKLMLSEENLKNLQSPEQKKVSCFYSQARISSLNGSALGGFLSKFFKKREESLYSGNSQKRSERGHHKAMTEVSYQYSGIKPGKMIHLTHLSQKLSSTASIYGVSGVCDGQISMQDLAECRNLPSRINEEENENI